MGYCVIALMTMSKEKKRKDVFWFLIFTCLWSSSVGLLSPKGVNFEGN